MLTAMRLPRVRVVVYSTCSVHREENEDVVGKLLEATGGAWTLVRCLPAWPTRGLHDTPHGELCVRAGAEDGTHGFFVARFEKAAADSDDIQEPQAEEQRGPVRGVQPKGKKKKRKLVAA